LKIETEHLIIRPLQPVDARPLAELWADPEVTRYLGGPRDRDEVERILREDAAAETPETFDLWPVVERATGEVVGHCGLLEKEVDHRPEIELVYVLRRASWGRGYATEAAGAIRDYAFTELGVRRLISLIHPGNESSERVARKVGMTLRGETLRSDGQMRRIYELGAPV
jgi:RimJ/RimL family protein N-acetyltransferase